MSERGEALLDYARWEANTAALNAQWRAARPFSHVVIDELLVPRGCDILRREFADLEGGRWIENRHYSQRLRSRNSLESFSGDSRAIIESLNSPRFRAWVSAITGIDGLFLDTGMTDGGLSAMSAGDHFDLHTDMQSHALHRTWRRRVNLVLYLNERWDPSWGGALELWDARATRRVAEVTPMNNRAVLFEVSPRAVHGVPEPLRCSMNTTRKNLVVYYYTEEREEVPITHFRYRARPGESARRPLVAANNALLALYQLTRRRVGDLDALAGRVLRRR